MHRQKCFKINKASSQLKFENDFSIYQGGFIGYDSVNYKTNLVLKFKF